MIPRSFDCLAAQFNAAVFINDPNISRIRMPQILSILYETGNNVLPKHRDGTGTSNVQYLNELIYQLSPRLRSIGAKLMMKNYS